MKKSGHRIVEPSGHLVIWRLSDLVMGYLQANLEIGNLKLENRAPTIEFPVSNFDGPMNRIEVSR